MDQLLPNCELQDDGSQLDGVDKAASENEANEGVEELEGPAQSAPEARLRRRVPEDLYATMEELGKSFGQHGASSGLVQ